MMAAEKKNICVLVFDYYGHNFSNLDFLFLFFCKLLKLLILYLWDTSKVRRQTDGDWQTDAGLNSHFKEITA